MMTIMKMTTDELDFLKGIVAQIDNPAVRHALEDSLSSMEPEQVKEILHPLTQLPMGKAFLKPRTGKGFMAFFE
jgi:hypothetical protein